MNTPVVFKELISAIDLVGEDGFKDISSVTGMLLETAVKKGFYGNIWDCFITDILVNSENVFSLGCELKSPVKGSVNDAALSDLNIVRKLFDIRYDDPLISDFSPSGEPSLYTPEISKNIVSLSNELKRSLDVNTMLYSLSAFYGRFGVGKFGLHKAFRIEERGEYSAPDIVPLNNMVDIKLDELVGYENAKKKLIYNTEAFVSGYPANNCLLYGDAGTGKSTSVKAIANEYYSRGLRIIEVYKHQLKYISSVISMLRNRNYKFIIYMDDLSFEEFETDYKYLKAVIEGDLEKRPDNVLIYATSNRRHLIKETFSDRDDRDDELHRSDTVQEKLSLAGRFGETIYFGAPGSREFKNIVKVLAQRAGIDMDEEELYLEANKWELSHGGLSGRTARQFIDHILGSGNYGKDKYGD